MLPFFRNIFYSQVLRQKCQGTLQLCLWDLYECSDAKKGSAGLSELHYIQSTKDIYTSGRIAALCDENKIAKRKWVPMFLFSGRYLYQEVSLISKSCTKKWHGVLSFHHVSMWSIDSYLPTILHLLPYIAKIIFHRSFFSIVLGVTQPNAIPGYGLSQIYFLAYNGLH